MIKYFNVLTHLEIISWNLTCNFTKLSHFKMDGMEFHMIFPEVCCHCPIWWAEPELQMSRDVLFGTGWICYAALFVFLLVSHGSAEPETGNPAGIIE